MDIDPLPAIGILADIAINPFGPTQIVALLLAVVCLFFSGFVSGSEIACFSLTPAQCEDLEGSGRGEALLKLISQPQKLLATILIANNLVNVTIVVLTNFALGPVFAGMDPVLSFALQKIGRASCRERV